VLTVFPLHHSRGDYYLADLASELSFVSGGWPEVTGSGLGRGQPGRWIGRGAGRLGLADGVAAAQLEAMLSGRRPADGRSLGPGRPGSVSAFDLTFAAPKSVSVLLALAPPEVAGEVLGAHEAAVAAAFDYVERRAVAVRRGSGADRSLLPVTGATAAAFTHGTSRAADPHLHTHLVLANLAQGADGRWSAVDGRGLFAHRRAAGELYRAHLRGALRERLGVQWVRTAKGYLEVAGVPPLVIGAFSSRRADIEETVAARGLGSGRARRVAWATTRDDKRAPEADAAVAWRSRAVALGFASAEVRAVWGRSKWLAGGVDERRFAAALGASPDGLPRRGVVEAWAAALDGGGSVRDVEDSVDRWAGTAGVAVGVGEPRRAIGPLIVPGHLVRALGPRPATAAAQDLWRDAARAVTRYRERWGVADQRRALGVDGTGRDLSTLPAARLAEHLVVSRTIDATRRALGRPLERTGAHEGVGRDR